MTDPHDPLSDFHFIISAPRSGSTWLARALNGHPEIFATENRLFGDFCEIWPNADGSMSPRITFDAFVQQYSNFFMSDELGLKPAQFRERFQRGFFNFLANFCRRQSGKSVLIDKVTPYLGSTELVFKQIHHFFPAAKTIQLIRDGRDVVTSGTFDWILKDSQGTDRFSFFVEKRPGLVMRRFFDDEVLRRWCRLWQEPINHFAMQKQRGNGPGMSIQYESMKQGQSEVMRQIFGYLDLKADEAAIERCIERATFEKMSGRKVGDDQQPLAKARKGISGDWKNYFTKRDGEIFQEVTGELLFELGYESDPGWISQLPNELEFICD